MSSLRMQTPAHLAIHPVALLVCCLPEGARTPAISGDFLGNYKSLSTSQDFGGSDPEEGT